MRTFVFGQTDEMAQEYFDQPACAQLANIGAEVLTDSIQLRKHDNVTVYLVGDWELNPKWPDILQRFRCLANVCVVKMFVAREASL